MTLATASDNSGSTSVRVTSAMPMGGRLAVPLKMQSDMRSARSILWLCSPSTQEIASTTLDLPQPLGPTMQVIPVPLNVIGVFSQNDLKPSNSTLRSLSTRPSQDRLFRGCDQRKKLRYQVLSEVYRDKNNRRDDDLGPTAWRYGSAVTWSSKVAWLIGCVKAVLDGVFRRESRSAAVEDG